MPVLGQPARPAQEAPRRHEPLSVRIGRRASRSEAQQMIGIATGTRASRMRVPKQTSARLTAVARTT